MPDERAKQTIRKRFSRYYEKNSVAAPPEIEKREFGAGVDTKIDFRHLTFSDERTLNAYVRTNAPLFISYSAAYYEFPDARPMQRKNWFGADLVFDLDAHDFETPCEHPPEWACEACLAIVKAEVQRLVDEFLVPDFGISENDLLVVFSGNQGYHIHVRSDVVRELNQQARKEIADYFTASHLSLRDIGFRREGVAQKGPTAKDYGWGGKLAGAIHEAVKNESDKEKLSKKLGATIKTAEKIINNREDVLRGMETGEWDRVKLPRGAWEKILHNVALQKAGQIDKNVTLDVSRLMRLPGSLHGGTGLQACVVKDLEKFSPFSDAVAFGEEPAKVRPRESLNLKLREQTFSLKEGEVIDLPEFAAMYALCRGVANAIL
jgi:DNA primase small subunit